MASALVLTAALGAQAPALGHGFVGFDEDIYVYENPMVRDGLTASGVAWAFNLHSKQTYFHPLTWLSLMLDAELLGAEPFGFHLVNVALHALVALALLWALIAATARPWPSALAASLFAVHPLTLEAVTWIAERKAVLSSALGLAAVLVYVSGRGASTPRRNAAVAGLHLLGLLAKPGMVLLPLLLLLLDYWPLGRFSDATAAGSSAARTAWRLAREKWAVFAVSAGMLALSVASISHMSRTTAPFELRAANAMVSIPRYLAAAAWPSGLAVFHPFPARVGALALVASAAAVAAITALAVVLRRRAPWLAFGWAWFLAGLAPYLGLKQVGLWPAWADRFAYVPLMGLCAAAAFGVADLLARSRARRLLPVLGTAAVLALGTSTLVQGRRWTSGETLFRSAAGVEPKSAVVRYNLATELMRSGSFSEARQHCEEAIRLDAFYAPPRVLLAGFLVHDGDLAGAEAQYREALRIDDEEYPAMFLLAEMLRKDGRNQEARALYARFLESAPETETASVRTYVTEFLAR